MHDPAPRGHQPREDATVVARVSPQPYGRETELPQGSTTPPGPRKAGVRFVCDYSAWSSGRLIAIPAKDATERVIRLLEQTGRNGTGATADAVASVRIASAGASRYVVTGAIGNFLIGRRRSRWLVVSLPGD